MKVSLILPFPPRRPQQLTPFFSLAQRRGVARVWSGQHFTVESQQLFAYMAGLGLATPVGLGVTLAPLRHPLEAANQARSLAAVTGHSVVAGFGSGIPELVEAMHGAAYRRPGTAMAEYVRSVRALLDQTEAVDGEYYRTGSLTLPQMPHPTVEIGLGVLRPGLARVAGGVADAAITWLCPHWYLQDTIVPALRSGAEAQGRPAPRVVAVVHVALERPDRDLHRLAFTAAGAHLTGPHYVDMLGRAGVETTVDDPVAGARALLDSGVFVTGDPAAVAKQVGEYHLAGVDEVVLNLTGVALTDGLAAAVAECEAVLDECGRQ